MRERGFVMGEAKEVWGLGGEVGVESAMVCT